MNSLAITVMDTRTSSPWRLMTMQRRHELGAASYFGSKYAASAAFYENSNQNRRSNNFKCSLCDGTVTRFIGQRFSSHHNWQDGCHDKPVLLPFLVKHSLPRFRLKLYHRVGSCFRLALEGISCKLFSHTYNVVWCNSAIFKKSCTTSNYAVSTTKLLQMVH